jgi:hypothetical protein
MSAFISRVVRVNLLALLVRQYKLLASLVRQYFSSGACQFTCFTGTTVYTSAASKLHSCVYISRAVRVNLLALLVRQYK